MKKFLSLILTAAMLLSVVSGIGINAYATADDYLKYGDINSDGKINSVDALLILSYAIGQEDLTDRQKLGADISGDGKINSSDALWILQIIVGQKPAAPIDYKDYSSLDPEWINTVVDNYNEFIAEVDGDSTRIPMIVSTDQHGSISADCEVFKLVNDITDWSKVSKVLNLGDTVYLSYNKKELKAYSSAMQYIPTEKRLELFGNHDGHLTALRRDMSKYFIAPSAVGTKKMDTFVVEDKDFNVRYLAIDPMGYPWTYTSGRITKEQADFIVAELEKKDASNIVLISHPYLFRDEMIKRDGTTFTGSEYFIGNETKDTDVKQSFLDMLLARKNKASGVFVDSDGKKHPYDFSECQGDFLMTLHGHHHTEGYETSNGITEFLFQSFHYDEQNCFYFAYIDTDDHTFKCWKNIEGYDAWEIEIA